MIILLVLVYSISRQILFEIDLFSKVDFFDLFSHMNFFGDKSDEHLLYIELNISENCYSNNTSSEEYDIEYKEAFEYNILSSTETPEDVAKMLVYENSLPQEFISKISLEIRRQIRKYVVSELSETFESLERTEYFDSCDLNRLFKGFKPYYLSLKELRYEKTSLLKRLLNNKRSLISDMRQNKPMNKESMKNVYCNKKLSKMFISKNVINESRFNIDRIILYKKDFDNK